MKIKWFIFSGLFFGLYLAQLFLVVPGTNVSPYAYKYGLLKNIRVLGLTYSALASILLLLFCFFAIVMKIKIQLSRQNAQIAVLSLLYFILNMLTTEELLVSVDSVIKIIMPFLILIFINTVIPGLKKTEADRLIISINLLVVGQVALCKLLTGSFAANIYYTEIEEEYFGFYNNPHPLSALLGLLSLWSIIKLKEDGCRFRNIALLAVNILLILLLRVRTYSLSFLIAAIYLVLKMISKKWKIPSGVYLLFFGVSALGAINILLFGDYAVHRNFAGDISSGRFFRWYTDLNFYFTQNTLLRQLMGNGAEFIYQLNVEKIGTYINSLNFIIDILIDSGILGLAILCRIYYLIMTRYMRTRHKDYIWSYFIYIMLGAMLNNILPYVTIMPMFIILLLQIEKMETQE